MLQRAFIVYKKPSFVTLDNLNSDLFKCYYAFMQVLLCIYALNYEFKK